MATPSNHPDTDVSCTVQRLDDLLRDWERNTGEGTTVLVIPHSRNAPIHMSVDGMKRKPVRIKDVVAHAIKLRGGG